MFGGLFLFHQWVRCAYPTPELFTVNCLCFCMLVWAAVLSLFVCFLWQFPVTFLSTYECTLIDKVECIVFQIKNLFKYEQYIVYYCSRRLMIWPPVILTKNKHAFEL